MPRANSASSWPGLAIPKGVRRSTEKGREDRAEAKVVKVVRPQVVVRDGHCRLLGMPKRLREMLFGECEGPSEWSHYNETHRRSKTVGLPPEQRHMVAHSMMLCRKHSQLYDSNRMRCKELTERGCDGPLRFWIEGHGVWEESA